MTTKEDIEKLIKKANEAKKGKLDLSSDEDLSIAIMNLVSIEEHFFFTGAKTDKTVYYDLLEKPGKCAKNFLRKLLKIMKVKFGAFLNIYWLLQ